MKTYKYKFDTAIILFVGLFALFAPIIMKTKSISTLIAPHALLIVIGGTLCAGCLSFSLEEIVRAFLSLKKLFIQESDNRIIALSSEIIELAKISRSKGILELARYLECIENPYLKKAVENLLEQNDTEVLRENLNMMSFYENKEDFKYIEIFEELGGYAPTFGIVGAIIGLIQISSINSDPKALLGGIATAFIATIYGVGSANLIFLPLAKKLKNILNEKLLEQEIITSAILDISNMQSSIIISEKLNRLIMQSQSEKKGKVLPFAA